MDKRKYYFYVKVKIGKNNTKYTYSLVGVGEYKMPQRSKHYKVAEALFNTIDNVVGFGFTRSLHTINH